jgi:flagellar hook assembly protein FlgD
MAMLSAEYNPVVNTAQLTYPGGSVTASDSVSINGSYIVNLAVYNGAGELIQTLATFETNIPITGLSVTGGVITTTAGVAQFYYNGLLLGSWNATTTSGQKVTNGVYLVKINSVDPMGVVTTVTQDVTVDISSSTLQIAVYNEAGEAVKTFTQQQLASLLTGGAILPADYNVGQAKLSSQTIDPIYGSPTSADNLLTITLGSGDSFTWNGRGDNGSILTPGVYFIEIQSQVPGQSPQQITMQIRVIGNNSNVSGVVMAPNPINLNQNTQAKFLINNPNLTFDSVEIRLYTVAGELMKTLESQPGNPSMVLWDLSGGGVASGAYLAVAELHSNGGLVGRQILRVVVLH